MDSYTFDEVIPVENLQRSRFNEQDDFVELDQVGAGSNGRCVLLKRKSDHVLRVCKIAQRIKVSKDRYEDKPLEASILLDVLPTHERILRLHHALIQPKTVQLYYDYYSHGDLSDLIWHYQRNLDYIPEAFMWHAYLQLTEALAFLHTGRDRCTSYSRPANWQAVIHGDLKPANIFLSAPNLSSPSPLCREYPSLVIGDFGLATLVEQKKPGTLIYQPPEMPATTKKADVWAVGCIMHVMAHYIEPLAPLPPGVANTNVNLVRWYTTPESRVPQPLDEYTPWLHDCVMETFTKDPEGRIDSFSLFRKVQRVFAEEIMPYIESNLDPLLPMDAREKVYNENGATMEDSRPKFFSAKESFEEGELVRNG